MSRTTLSGQTGKPLFGLSGNAECIFLGRVACLMGAKYHKLNYIEEPGENLPHWFYCTQAYDLNKEECKEFAAALINVTDEVIDTIYPVTYTFVGTKQELKATIIWYGKYFARLKNGYKNCD